MPFDTNDIHSLVVQDYSSFDNNGIRDDPVWTKHGKTGGAYQFDGIDDVIIVSDSPSLDLSSSAFSIEAWVNTTTAASQTLINKWDTTSQVGYGLYVTENPALTLVVGDGSGMNELSVPVDYADGDWHHVVATVDSEIKLYFDGELQGAANITVGGDISNDTDFTIGGADGVGYFGGVIDEVKIYMRTLTPQQIDLHYVAGLVSKPILVIASEETALGEVWQVTVTPNSQIDDGETVASNELQILGPTQNGELPVADPNGPYTGTVGVPVAFDGSGSLDPDGTIISYIWDYGEGTTDSGVAPTHTYAAAGTYTVTLTVLDDDGLTDTATTTATINGQTPGGEVGGNVYPADKLTILVPWILLAAALIVGVTIAVKRRRTS
jgi:hypothetical protein